MASILPFRPLPPSSLSLASSSPPSTLAVQDTVELRRILALPRRDVDQADLAEEMTKALKKPEGTMTLRPIQALALYEIGTVGGMLGPQRVGAGKTLCSFLAPVVAFASRPLLVIPAKLMEKTRRDQYELSKHWDIGFIRIMTYEWLGRTQAAEALEKYQPDMIVLDECHKVRNTNASVSRRIHRWFRAHEDCKCVAMSGTITKRSLHDYEHILQWIYAPEDYPLPQTLDERERWADALDERKGQTKRASPGALQLFLSDPEERALWHSGETRRAARRAFRRHFVATPGVVATHETPIDAALNIQSITDEAEPGEAIDQAFHALRYEWITPDGWELMDGLEMFRHSRELAMGFYYKWDPRPPAEWMLPRKGWAKMVREIIKNSGRGPRPFDSEKQVRDAMAGDPTLEAWLAVKDTFIPNTVPVWIDDYLIEFVAQWAQKNRGIVWTEHRCVGERLTEETGIPYYGRKGQSAAGRIIENHPVGEPMIASVQSNSEGRNLQAWNANLILSMPPNGSQSEQLIGRTHRDGQEADEVQFDVVMNCREHVHAFAQAVKDAQYVFDSTGSPQKLLVASVNVLTPGDLMFDMRGPRW